MQLYHTQKKEYKEKLFKSMQLCSYTLSCDAYSYDFVPKKSTKLYELSQNNQTINSYFPILDSEKFYLEIAYPYTLFEHDISDIRTQLWIQFIIAFLILFFVALWFTFYSLSPIRKAIQINDEFIKDILHDFNTPISAMVLNIQMFNQTQKEKNPFLKRISSSIDNILLLQNNLKCFLMHQPTQNSQLDIGALALKRIRYIENIYPKISFDYEEKNKIICLCNEELLTRIIDNILSNAAKYNKLNGQVHIIIEETKLSIQDTGKGIQNISKVSQRYYKEQDRGIGLGLHIVHKLVQELNIHMQIDSTIDVGSTFVLDFRHLLKE